MVLDVTFWSAFHVPFAGNNSAFSLPGGIKQGTATMKNILKLALAVSSFAMGVQAAHAQAADEDTATAESSVTIIQPLTVKNESGLHFGRIVKPRSGNGTVAIANTGDTVSATDGAVALSGLTTSRAVFTILGEGGQAMTVKVPETVELSGAGDPIEVTLDPDVVGSTTLSGDLGEEGKKTVNVGGKFSLPSAQATGLYEGKFEVYAAYE